MAPEFQRRAFADGVRELAYKADPAIRHYGLKALVNAYGWERAKEQQEIRAFLQNLGAGAREVLGEDVWVNHVLNRLNPLGWYVITDVRYPNEADAIAKQGGEVWRIEREGVGPVNGHATETAMDDYRFDKVLFNNGTTDALRECVRAQIFEGKETHTNRV